VEMNEETVKLLRQLDDDVEAGLLTVLTVNVEDSWMDDPSRGRPHKVLSSRTWHINARVGTERPHAR